MALFALDRQHTGKPGNWSDPGAWYDLDSDGATELHEAEARLTRPIMAACEDRLLELRHAVVCLSDGSYAERHERVKRYRAKAYVALHLNATARHGLVVRDRRSTAGLKLARRVATALAFIAPELDVDPLKRVVIGDTVGYPRAAACVQGVYDGVTVGLVYEPASVDIAEHRELLTPGGLARLGWALADGLDNWAREG